MTLLHLTAQDVLQALPMQEAIAACREGFLALAQGRVEAPPRVHLTDGGSQDPRTTLLMAASGPVGRVTKVVSIFPGNRRRGIATTSGMVTILDPDTGHAIGLCDGGTLTAIRTGAVAGLATDLLARPEATVAALIGAGGLAEHQALALAAVRRLSELRVYSPTPARRDALVARLSREHRLPAVAVGSPAAAVRGADIVSVATNSLGPVFHGADLAPGAHVNGVGSFKPSMRELDETTIRRAGRIVVDLRDSARHEAGELIAAHAAGVTHSCDWLELGTLLSDPDLSRHDPYAITLFKSVGHAVQDLYAARCALDRAHRLGLGQALSS